MAEKKEHSVTKDDEKPYIQSMSILHIEEDGLRKAGVRSYFIEVQKITGNNCEVIFKKQKDFYPPENEKN